MFLPYAEIRIGITLLFLIIGSYFDIFKEKNIPDKLLYSFVGVAFLTNVFAFDNFAFIYGIVQSLIIGGITYLSYKRGHIGGAEVFYFAAISLLIPYYNTIVPFIISVLIFATLLFAITMAFYTLIKLWGKKHLKPNYAYIVLALLYIAFIAYLYFTPSFALLNKVFLFVVSILFITSLYFGMFKRDIEKLMIGYVEVNKAKEEVVVSGINKDVDAIMGNDKVIGEKHISVFKKKGITTIPVFKHLPPFLPFLTLGFILALFYESALFFF